MHEERIRNTKLVFDKNIKSLTESQNQYDILETNKKIKLNIHLACYYTYLILYYVFNVQLIKSFKYGKFETTLARKYNKLIQKRRTGLLYNNIIIMLIITILSVRLVNTALIFICN